MVNKIIKIIVFNSGKKYFTTLIKTNEFLTNTRDMKNTSVCVTDRISWSRSLSTSRTWSDILLLAADFLSELTFI
jgi:hypothetical protein